MSMAEDIVARTTADWILRAFFFFFPIGRSDHYIKYEIQNVNYETIHSFVRVYEIIKLNN